MPSFVADLHIHSRYSRATSKALTPRVLAAHAAVKGIGVCATGDCTHPKWLEELEADLVEDGSGLLALKDEKGLDDVLPWLDHLPGKAPRFVLSSEISSIYKRGGKTRKVHNLVFLPGFDAARRLNQRLARIGNLTSDGRPILGLDSRDLLEIVLQTDPRAYLIPAHIWTPWFSLFGSKSGFDRIEDCFGDLTNEVFALETGLSSDPEMNWRISALDRFSLVSNSDAHSGEKLGREVNLFEAELSFDGMRRALRREGSDRLAATVEFFPEEGKYHLDGHRECGVVLEPGQSRELRDLCPVCGKPLTLGVLHRVMDLADRTEPQQPAGAASFVSLIPLDELVAESLQRGVGTKQVVAKKAQLLEKLGPELSILRDAPAEDVAKISPRLATALARMRAGEVIRHGGYDGVFGRIKVFQPGELTDQNALAKAPKRGRPKAAKKDHEPGPEFARAVNETPDGAGDTNAMGPIPAADPAPAFAGERVPAAPSPDPLAGLNDSQRAAVLSKAPHQLVLAGPGTGKTATLTARIRHLLDQGVAARHILAVTFTRKAAEELRERLLRMLPADAALPKASTLHALALEAAEEAHAAPVHLLSEEASRALFDAGLAPELPAARRKALWAKLGLARENLDTERLGASDDLGLAARAYAARKSALRAADFTDLLEGWLTLSAGRAYQSPYVHVLVDEVQDLSPLQLEVLKLLAPARAASVFAIGDPHQSIYGFRGSLPGIEHHLAAMWPGIERFELSRNYRSHPRILAAAAAMYPKAALLEAGANITEPATIHMFHAPTALAEAKWIAARASELLGGSSLSAAKSSQVSVNPADMAVLVRVGALIPVLHAELDRLGVPVAAPAAQAPWLSPGAKRLLGMAEKTLGLPASGDDRELPGLPAKALSAPFSMLPGMLSADYGFDPGFFSSKTFAALSRLAADHGGLAGLLRFVAQENELELSAAKAEKVRIMSVHAAKGLEFEAVFLPAMEDGLFPFAGTEFFSGKVGTPPDEAEEHRLFYVAVTRAKSRLFISYADKRQLFGRSLQLRPSRYLAAMPKDGLAHTALRTKKVAQATRLSLMS